jgi:hypothetical protein
MELIAGLKNKSLEWYDPSIDKWTYGPSLTNHYAGTAVTLNNRIFVCGGQNDGRNQMRHLSSTRCSLSYSLT